ncbi:MAG TPA: ABC transporter substrate-binding protein [Xanthobacteraceae bacterium]|jgi:putative ABC transport system substrate-binding protein
MMKRREFIALLGGSAAAWPVAASAQQAERARRVGVLMNSANGAFGQPRARAFQQELQRLGWIDDRNIAVEYRWGEDRFEQFAAVAAEFVRLDVDVIVTVGTPATLRAKEATSVIPIVFVGSRDPVRTGLVASLERPGGNITGISNQNPNIASRRIKLLQDFVPDLSRLAILANADDVSGALEVHDTTQAAGALGIDVIASEIRRAEDIAPALASLHGPALALYVVADALTNTHAGEISALALAARLPTIYAFRQLLESGGLLSYGLDGLAQYRGAAALVDKILRGARPADIPVVPPAKLELAVNLTTAKALGLTVPPNLLSTADAVIE